jgi:HEPN domain-containing protein
MREAEPLFADEDWSLCVRRCQEAVEMALKALLRAAWVEVSKVHDVSGALRQNVDRLPPAVAAEIDTLVSASRRLREEHELAFYGDEETQTKAEALYARGDAEESLALARRSLRWSGRANPLRSSPPDPQREDAKSHRPSTRRRVFVSRTDTCPGRPVWTSTKSSVRV